MFFSFGAVALLVIWLSSSQQRRPLALVAAGMLTLYPILESMLQGSRSTLVHVAFLVFIFARSSKAMPWLVRSPWALTAAGVALAALIELIYELRTLQGVTTADEMADIFKTTAIGLYARPPQWIEDGIISTGGTGLVGGFLKVWTHIIQYLTHSWVVYFINFAHFEGPHGWGSLHFFVPLRVISALSGETFDYDAVMAGVEPGVSGTFVSLVFYDFGALGPVLAALFGAAATLVHRRAQRFPERWLPLNTYLCFAILTMGVDNPLVGGLGQFATWAYLAYVPMHYIVTLLGERSRQAPRSSAENTARWLQAR
jgi:hypothetical protein